MNANTSYYEINIKYGMPSCRDAMYNAKAFLKLYRSSVKCLVFIHGYGSTGKGGVIKKDIRRWLLAQQRKGAVKSVIGGEDFDIFNRDAIFLKDRCPELKRYINRYNAGITIVEY